MAVIGGRRFRVERCEKAHYDPSGVRSGTARPVSLRLRPWTGRAPGWDGDAVETRAIDLTAALLVATAALCCSVVVGCAFLLVAGDAEIAPGDWAARCVAAAIACATVAALIALMRAAGGLRPSALGVAWALAFAWPLSGIPVPAALVATLGTGLAVLWGADRAGGRDRARVAAWLAAAALGLLIVALVATGGEDAAFRPHADARATAPARSASPPAAREAPLVVARPRPSPARAVRAYYRALDRRDFSRAWRALSPTVRTDFGGLERWRAGFATTLASVPSELRVTASSDEATVDHVLTARDRAQCGVLVQRFSVHWRLRRTAGAWRATALSAQPAAQACS